MPNRNAKPGRVDLVILVSVVAVAAVVISVVGSSAAGTGSKVASSAYPKQEASATGDAAPAKEAGGARGASTSETSPSSPDGAAPVAPQTLAPPASPPATPSEEPPADNPRPVYAVPPSIDATGTTDVTDELLGFIASVPDGSVIHFPPNATYRAERSLQIKFRNDLVFEGNGATIVADSIADRNRRHWWFQEGSNITFRDMTVRGANPNAGTSEEAADASLEAQHGFDFGGVDGVTLERVTVTDVYGDFVYLGQARDWTKHVVIRDSHFERNGRQGVAITAAEDVLITNNYIGDTRRATFDIEPNGDGRGARDIRIINNQIGPGRLLFLAAVGSSVLPIENVLIQGNVLTGRALNMSVRGAVPPEAATRANIRIIDNRSNAPWGNPGGAVMNFVAVDGVEVIGNTQPLQAGRGNGGVNVLYSCGVRVEGNAFDNATEELRTDNWSCGEG